MNETLICPKCDTARVVFPSGVKTLCRKIGVHTCRYGSVHIIDRENIGRMFENMREEVLYSIDCLSGFMDEGIANELKKKVNLHMGGLMAKKK